VEVIKELLKDTTDEQWQIPGVIDSAGIFGWLAERNDHDLPGNLTILNTGVEAEWEEGG